MQLHVDAIYHTDYIRMEVHAGWAEETWPSSVLVEGLQTIASLGRLICAAQNNCALLVVLVGLDEPEQNRTCYTMF